VDRSIEPADKKVVIAAISGELTVKRFRRIDGKAFLVPENEKYKAIELTEETGGEIWGVVTNVIHSL
jgi:DNA polymerase V